MNAFEPMQFLRLSLVGLLVAVNNGCSIVEKDRDFFTFIPRVTSAKKIKSSSTWQKTEPDKDSSRQREQEQNVATKTEGAILDQAVWIPDHQEKKRNSKKKKKKKKNVFELDGIPVYGFVEKVFIGPNKLKVKAKLDSGAGTSSLNAMDVVEFERDGKKWVRFYMMNPTTSEKVEFERKVKRYARVKEHSGDSQRRPVVLMDVKLGKSYIEREFTLADRSNFLYPVLLGRNFLSGVALIDTSRSFLATTRSPGQN